MILPLAVFAQLAATCAPDVAPETLAALARTESGFDPFVIGDNTTRQAHHPHDQAEAIRTATLLLDAGHSIDLGVMQINSKNMQWLGLTVESVFDPCENIRAGATVLTAYSRYNTGSPTRGFANGYVQKVVSKMRQLPAVPAVQSGESSKLPQKPPPPPPAPPNWRAFEAAESASQEKPWLITSREGE
jgi:type IV secretion system protein VirB1